MAKRGIELIAIHFASPPYTSQRAEQKVHSLLRQVAKYSGRIMLFVVPFTEQLSGGGIFDEPRAKSFAYGRIEIYAPGNGCGYLPRCQIKILFRTFIFVTA